MNLKPEAEKALVQAMDRLSARWADEKEYEDFSEYQAAMKKVVEKQGLKFFMMIANPFRCVFMDEAGKQGQITVGRHKINVKTQN